MSNRPEGASCRFCGCTRVTACDVPTDYGSRACQWIGDHCDAVNCRNAAAELFALGAMDAGGCPQCGERGPCMCGLEVKIGGEVVGVLKSFSFTIIEPPRYPGPPIEPRSTAPSSPPAIPARIDRTPIPGGRRS